MYFTGRSTSLLGKLDRNNCPNAPWHSYQSINYWKQITVSLSIPSNWFISLGNWKIIIPSAWTNWKHNRNECGFRCKSSQPQSEDAFPRKTPNSSLSLQTSLLLYCSICKLQVLKTPSHRCFVRRPIPFKARLLSQIKSRLCYWITTRTGIVPWET